MERSLKPYFPVFVLPTLAAFIIGFIWPFLQGIYLSFTEFRTVKNTTFVGLKNYFRAVKDPEFIHAFLFTAAFTVVTVLLINVLAFAVALAFTQKFKGTNLFRTIFFMPNLIGGIVLGYIWQLIFNGILAHFDLTLKISTTFGFWGLVILICWQQIGYMMIIYIAGLQAIPGDFSEAAQIDGANRWQRMRHVIIPNVMPAITICTFLTVTNGFKLFDQNLSLTAGEPMKSTEMLALNIYNTFYGRVGWQGVGQAKAVLFFILVVSIGLIQLKLTRSREVQQ
ncbi:MAG: sugar ABC transporter permease [Eubacteriales bacterium]|jgi:raffinose/stachyose/melibiose transport system permease protein|nr:sugar ABC transporter permease [Eubacteriales bacterium]